MLGHEKTTAGRYKSARQSLRPLPQPPSASPPSGYGKSHLTHSRGQSFDDAPKLGYDGAAFSSPSIVAKADRPQSMVLSRADSIIPSSSLSQRPHVHHAGTSPHGSAFSSPDLTTLSNSSTSHLRTLSKFAQQGSSEDFSIASPAPSVVGLQGRRQLKRTDSTRGSKGSAVANNRKSYAWEDRNWMDKQRQFLQAYEYLCHIGEAKEWVEDIIHKTLPPIVQLEEALRDGVTLAEIVQALNPNHPIRIFRHAKLQFRHSDNIAQFFRFLADVELPELFRFELIDLYEKKNIPKVIYCIHALSWLLYRKGIVGFRIGNLVGQLEFEHHELEEMQKGLDKAGISMPSFSGMGASFGAEPEPQPEVEPEPVESEEERIERELGENEIMVLDFQAQLRGALIRMGLGRTMQRLWESEETLIELQSIVRGGWARQVFDYRLSMKQFAVNLQGTARGFIVRRRQQCNKETWKSKQGDITFLQSLIRAKRPRAEIQNIKLRTQKEESSVRQLQAAIRGALRRNKEYEQLEQTKNAEMSVKSIQAALRGMLQRQRIQDVKNRLRQTHSMVSKFQAVSRGIAVRSFLANQEQELENLSGLWRSIQAISRGKLSRQLLQETKTQLCDQQHAISALQAKIRGRSIRQDIGQIRSSLLRVEKQIGALQAASRACLFRRRYMVDLQALRDQEILTTALQACSRGFLHRQSLHYLHENLLSNTPEIIDLQALARAMLSRTEVGILLSQLEDEEPVIVEMQAAIRGKLVREKFAEKRRFFRQNMEKVVKVQSYIRGKLQGEAYKSLTNGNNPPVGTVKSFVHLLNDSDFDFDEEVEFERLRKTVVQHVRQNEMADQYITQLDIKIALLVKNKITLDEVVKHQKHFGGDAGSLLTNTEISSKDPFDLKALNKNSRRKLEHYQELFFLLQTQPQYLARLFRRFREQAYAEKECERIKHLMMGLFGYAQKRREEYYLIKLIVRSMKEEIDSCQSIQEYLRGNFFWAKLFRAYVKSPRDRKYMRDILGPIINESVIDNSELDLESDPMQIYLSTIENEQLRTGQRSQRSPDIPREEAIRDPETKRTFIAHLQDLRDIADQFFTALEEHLHKMPFGVRYIAQQMFQNLTSRFQHDEQGHILQIVGHWVWKSYLQPALVEPEKFGAIDRGLSQVHKRNINEVAKVLSQIAAGKLFGSENVFLQPLNSYVGESIERLGETWGNCKWRMSGKAFRYRTNNAIYSDCDPRC